VNYDIVIQGGTVVTASGIYCADVAVQGQRIAAIGKALTGQRVLDASGCYVIPGGVDIHVHMQMSLSNGVTSADTFFTGTRAAALGGTTTIIDFVEAETEESLLAALAKRRTEADPQVVIDYGLHMTIGPDDIDKLDQLPGVYAAGCTSFKLYMAYGLRLTDDQLLAALGAIRAVGGFSVIHAENWDVICALVAQNLAAGCTTPHWHPRSRPAILEGEAAGRAIDIATYVGTPLHIFHVSCAAVVERIKAARSRGLPITGETCPQYLFLTQDAYDAPGVTGALPVCSPPLRRQSDQTALWQALAHGDLQMVTTDHCPFRSEDKARGLHDYSQIPGGVPSIEMRLSALYSRGVRSGLLSLSRWVDLCCTTPARLTGLSNKGEVAIGYDADLVIFDPNAQHRLSTETLHENVDWTPYAGLALQGWPRTTLSRGAVIVENSEFIGAAGRGQFVQR
jgi:dihydropyrimidinase